MGKGQYIHKAGEGNLFAKQGKKLKSRKGLYTYKAGGRAVYLQSREGQYIYKTGDGQCIYKAKKGGGAIHLQSKNIYKAGGRRIGSHKI